MARAGEAVAFQNIAATTAPFALDGGKYGVQFSATGSGTVTLERQGPDSSTFLSVGTSTAFAASPGYAVVDLPPGQYKFVVATFTAIYVEIVRIPGE